jgi:hypothetical protein
MTSVRFLALTTVGLLSATLGTTAFAVDLKPKTFPLTVMGVKTAVPVTISFDANTDGDALALRVQGQASLKDIQDRALDIARAIPMPGGNCDRSGINPVVNSVDAASITPGDTTAIVAVSGQVTAWACTHPAGITVKTIAASDSVTLTVPVAMTITDGTQIGLKLAGPVAVTTGHALTKEAIDLLTGDISASITSQLATALNAGDARATLPTLPGLTATIEALQFAANGPELLVRASARARMSGEAFNSLLTLMSK